MKNITIIALSLVLLHVALRVIEATNTITSTLLLQINGPTTKMTTATVSLTSAIYVQAHH